MDGIVREARERLEYIADRESENRNAALEDMRFVHIPGSQWPEMAINLRSTPDAARPCLEINQLPQFIHQVLNDIRQNRPSIRVKPVEDQDEEAAEIYDGLIRFIQNDSNSDQAYDTGAQHAIEGGFGYWRIVPEYVRGTLDQCLKIKRIKNPFSVYYDPDCMEADGSDALDVLITEELRKDRFDKLYPKANGGLEPIGTGDTWFSKDHVRIAEYFKATLEDRTLVQLANGIVVPESEAYGDVVRTETVQVRKVRWYKVNGSEILDEREWPGIYIPVVPVYGESLYIDGKVVRYGLIRFAKDPQRMYNYMVSTDAEMLALSPKAPFIGEEGQFEGLERIWERANVEARAYLPYKGKSIAGQPLPPPQRQLPVQASSLVHAAKITAKDDLRSTIGIYSTKLGESSSETSGKAILARQRQSDTTVFHYTDNLSKSIKYTGRILVDLIPHYYDTNRTIRILGEDGVSKAVQLAPHGQQGGIVTRMVGNQIQKIFDPSVGRYDVVVTSGPSYATKRIEAADSMMQFAQTNPNIMSVAGDLIAKAMDWPMSDKISARLKAILPPQLQNLDEGGNPAIAAMQAQMQKMGQAVQQQMAEIQKARAEVEAAKAELSKKEAQLAVKEIKQTSDGETMNLSREVGNERMKLAMAQLNLKDEKLKLAEQQLAEMLKRVEASVQEKSQVEAGIGQLAQMIQNMIQTQESGAKALSEAVSRVAETVSQVAAYQKAPKTAFLDSNGNITGIKVEGFGDRAVTKDKKGNVTIQ